MQSNLPKRCHHIKTNGTQCGSPALRDETLCYFHHHSGTREIQVVGAREIGYLMLAPFEDAYSIQSALHEVTRLLLERRIEHKTASLVLYALQTASANLKRIEAEKPQPAEVVVDLDKLADTPLPMTPPSRNGSSEPSQSQPSKSSRKKNGEPSEEQIQRQLDYLLYLGQHLADPAGTDPEIERLRRRAEGDTPDESDDGLPPGTIQACATRKEYII